MNLDDVVPKCRYGSIEELLEEISQHEFPGFRPHAFYNETGDILEVFVTQEPYYVQRVGNGIHVCISFATGQIVGVQLWGASRKLAKSDEAGDTTVWVKAWDDNGNRRQVAADFNT